ncbi:MAG: cell wall hydrolase [Rhodospirillales bacterium]|nr:cell wall hydrolase [Rhodospirillales bacterium]MDH3917880.1 cell wall hydrolase [Rhodospirillales bacterium]
MIENVAKQLIISKKAIARSASALGGGRMVLPAGLLACATALGLLVEAGSGPAEAHYSEGVWATADIRPISAALYWDEPSYPRTSATQSMNRVKLDLAEVDLGVGEKLGRSDIDGTLAHLPGPAVTALGLEEAKLAPVRQLQEELNCLALNIYFEARNEPSKGQAAVAHVVLNRVSDPRFPDTVCKVVRQGGERVRHRCQFSWWCDGLSDRPRNRKVWEASKAMAGDVYWGRSEDPTNGAMWYHADYVMPYWGRVFKRGPKIGRHIFYHGRKQRTQVAANQEAE